MENDTTIRNETQIQIHSHIVIFKVEGGRGFKPMPWVGFEPATLVLSDLHTWPPYLKWNKPIYKHISGFRSKKWKEDPLKMISFFYHVVDLFLLPCCSLFVWTNETVNVWSHLLGFVFFFWLMVWDNAVWIPAVGGGSWDHVVLSIGMICFQVGGSMQTIYSCCLCSGLWWLCIWTVDSN